MNGDPRRRRKPRFEEARDELRSEVAMDARPPRRSPTACEAIDDLLAGGATLEEVADNAGMETWHHRLRRRKRRADRRLRGVPQGRGRGDGGRLPDADRPRRRRHLRAAARRRRTAGGAPARRSVRTGRRRLDDAMPRTGGCSSWRANRSRRSKTARRWRGWVCRRCITTISAATVLSPTRLPRWASRSSSMAAGTTEAVDAEAPRVPGDAECRDAWPT